MKLIGGLIKIVLILFMLLAVLTMCRDKSAPTTKVHKPNPPEGCYTNWTKESSKHGLSTRAYDGRRVNGERQYLVDWEEEKIWVSHIRIEMNSCIWELN